MDDTFMNNIFAHALRQSFFERLFDGIGGIILCLLVIVWLVFLFIALEGFADAAEKKGYNRKFYWWICFITGFIGYLLVIALPTISKEEQEQTRLETARQNKMRTEHENYLAQQEKERAVSEYRAKMERQQKIDEYWAQHTEEKEALLNKQAQAKEKLKKLSPLATDEKQILKKLIDDIDTELTRERE